MKKLHSLLILLILILLSGCNTTITNTTTTKIKNMFKSINYNETIDNFNTLYIDLVEENEGYLETVLNPYKEKDIKITCIFKDKDDVLYTKDAYYYQEYNLSIMKRATEDFKAFDDEIEGLDYATKVGNSKFRISFRPKKSGLLSFEIKVFIKEEFKQSFNGQINVLDNDTDYKGKIMVDETNNRFFKYEFGGTYLPIGQNNAWDTSYSRKTYDYDEWFKRMEENNMNYSRIWLASWGFALHIGTGAKVDNFTSRQNQLARLDRVLALAEEMGIYITLCLNNHGQFSNRINPEWKDNPYKDIISFPNQFFYKKDVIDIYKDEVRYIISRYSDYDSIMSYELFNEVDWTDNFNMVDFKKWAKDISGYIKEIDPYDRLITNSYMDINKDNGVFNLDTIDYVSIHKYLPKGFNEKGIVKREGEDLQRLYNSYNKPVIFEEWGVNANSAEDTYKDDANGIALYQAMMGSILYGGSGTAMAWWWDYYIHKYNLYTIYKGMGALSDVIDLSGDITYVNQENFTISDSNIELIGIKTNDSYYLYIYDKNYTKSSTTSNDFNITISKSLDSSEYSLSMIDTLTGELTNLDDFNNDLDKELSFNNDLILIINKK